MNALALGKISSPNVVKGELELEYFGSYTFDDAASKDNKQKHEFEIEYGLTDRVLVEFGGELKKNPGKDTKYEATEFALQYQLFENGENWLDSAIELGYEHVRDRDEPDVVVGKLLLQKDIQKFQHLANINFEQQVGHNAKDAPELEIRWSSRYRFMPYFEPGFEVQSEFGHLNDIPSYRAQEHYIGPAAYGKIWKNINYEAAYLFGASDAAADGALRTTVELEFYF